MAQNKSLPSRQRFENKNAKELEYEKLFPPYTTIYNYRIYFINELTSEEEIDYLIHIAHRTVDFVIDTECTYRTNFPALIQIHFVQSLDVESPLVLVEINFLPDYSSVLFSKFKELFDCVFNVKSHLFSWGLLRSELTRFASSRLFSLPVRSIIHNVQGQFRPWFNQWIKKYYLSSTDHTNEDLNDMVIIDAPSYDPTLILSTELMNDKKLYCQESWSLQDAILYIFGQYLSKRETLRKWSMGLDIRLSTRDTSFSSSYCQKLIRYACLDCLSVAHIHLFMKNSNIPLDMTYVQQCSTSGEYLFSNNLNVVSDIFQFDDESSSSSEDYNIQLVAVHAPNERHQSPAPVIQIDHQQEEIETTTIIPTTVCRLHKRSVAAQKRRNQKTSRRHRANRYNYEIIRPSNMKSKPVKKLLRQHHIKFTNVNVIRSILYIGVKSDGDKQLYEQILPSDMFI